MRWSFGDVFCEWQRAYPTYVRSCSRKTPTIKRNAACNAGGNDDALVVAVQNSNAAATRQPASSSSSKPVKQCGFHLPAVWDTGGVTTTPSSSPCLTPTPMRCASRLLPSTSSQNNSSSAAFNCQPYGTPAPRTPPPAVLSVIFPAVLRKHQQTAHTSSNVPNHRDIQLPQKRELPANSVGKSLFTENMH